MRLAGLTLVCLTAGSLALGAACAGEHRAARDRYNEGVAALARREYEAAEKALLDARSQAGVDPELRFRAAYDLGMAFGAHADQRRIGKDADLTLALDLAQQAAWWFRDAQQLRPDDADTRINLGVMRARVQAIGDELRKGEGKLEVRLDRLIGEQRGVLDEARGAWLAIKQAGGADPLAQQSTLTQLADREREIGAEAGVVGDLAADEIDAIGKKPEDKRSDEEKVRVIQLKNLDLYLMEGRTRITEARRKLQELAAEDGVARSEAALIALKRAREQLLDPITVMKRVAQDQLGVLQDTALTEPRPVGLGDAPQAGPLPGWLEPGVIAERQGSVRTRLEEVRARLTAAAEAPAPGAGSGAAALLTPSGSGSAAPPTPPTQDDPRRAKLIERVKAALPAVGDASAAMDRAHQALAAKQVQQALEHEQAALEALGRAIEQFSDLKQLVELAWAEHQQLLGLLAPEAARQVDSVTRARRTREALSHNLGRMPRIQQLLADELAQLDEQARQLAAKAGEPAKDPKQAEAQNAQLEQAKQQLEQARQQMTHGEELRGQAATALAALDKALTANQDPMPPARDADAKLTELRKLLFSVIEHLQELIREQGETRDQTTAASGEDDFTRGPKLPGLIGRQDGHAQMAKAITDALAAQADAAGKQPAQPGPQHGPDAKALAGAADEVRQSQGDMADAGATLTKARDSRTATLSLDPAAKSQGKALEHLENALRLLQPPPRKNDQDQKQQQKQKQDQQQQQGGAGQRARDEDARRQRARHDRDAQNDPVEKDW
jgi:Ca-activated chloride channel homolog